MRVLNALKQKYLKSFNIKTCKCSQQSFTIKRENYLLKMYLELLHEEKQSLRFGRIFLNFEIGMYQKYSVKQHN